MGRKIKVWELRKGMRVAREESGWYNELTVFEVKPPRGGIVSWTVYADNNGVAGEFRCFTSSAEFEVLEEAPLPPEPGPEAIVRIGSVDYRNTGDDDETQWHRVPSRGASVTVAGHKALMRMDWGDLVNLAERAGVTIETVYEPPRPADA